MGKRAYQHSAYWYQYHYGKTYSEATSYTGAYIDMHTYRPRKYVKYGDFGQWERGEAQLDDNFNPFLFGIFIVMDIAIAMKTTVERLADPNERAIMKEELRRDLRMVFRAKYYERETARRRALACERRKIDRRYTTAPMPTAKDIREAWDKRKESKEAMIRLGGMLHDLACYVDSALRFNENGDVIGRNHGIRGWIDANTPELSEKYKTLMRYKALAIKLRQATGTKDPTPTAKLLDEPRCETVVELLKDFRITFSSLVEDVSFLISPDTVFVEKKWIECMKERERKLKAKREKRKMEERSLRKIGRKRTIRGNSRKLRK